ncbi:iron-regulated protein FrpC, partial [Kingella kingae]|nr:iron-regulated protein FrpC [Kingella kingae]
MLLGSEPLFPYGDDGYQCLKPWVEQPPRTNKAHGYDPLILNLDGKGIQTLAPSSVSARFDHNADGIATATGWTAAGNGILALGLDKNGKIDSGKEIFGNHSVLSNGATAA